MRNLLILMVVPDVKHLSSAQDVDGSEELGTVLNMIEPSLRHNPLTPPSTRKKKTDSSGTGVESTVIDEGDPSSPTTQRCNSIMLDELIKPGNAKRQKLRRFREFIDERKAAYITMRDGPEKTAEGRKIDRLEKAWDIMQTARYFATGSILS